MGQEQQPSPLRHIHIDLQEGQIIFEGADGRAIFFNPRELIAQLATPLPDSEPPTVEAPAAEVQQKQQQIHLSGKLKTQPTEGNPDSRKRPTATARLAVHQEGNPDAKMYFATFHGATREMALSMPVDTRISVLGYQRPAKEAGKLDSFSVMRITAFTHPQPRNAN